MESIWTKSAQEFKTQHRTKELPKTVETAVIGAGMAGILCAWLLREAGIKAVVFEAATVGSGQTKNTTAKITAQHGLIYERLVKTVGARAAGQYARANQEAIREYGRIVQENGIHCGFKRLPAYLYTNTDEGMLRLELERSAVVHLGLPVSMVYQTELPVPVKAALKLSDQAQFRPLEFLHALAERMPVYEHTPVFRVRGHELVTNRGTVRAEKVIFATHFPFPNMPGFYFARMHQERSFVLAFAVSVKQILSGMYYGIDTDGLSFRSTGDTLLLGGGSRRTGTGCQKDSFAALRFEAERLYPGYTETAAWAAQDCMTLDGIPYIGRFSVFTPDWYVATGFGKWGMTGSMTAAMALRDMITGRETKKWQVFSPQRLNPRAATVPFLKNGAVALKNLLTPGGPRCRHLGCKLVYNRAERSWDCPCHGSRYSHEGKLIDNPAQKGLERV
ncbi:MAG: FAD-dependent oxidoreductase [Lachnospiraceae bacterium]|nr:FAD-dependent oxidoreductase [Lachnospiraceae bacterium]